MPLFTKALALTAALTFIGGAHAKLDLNSKDNTVVYWGKHWCTNGRRAEQGLILEQDRTRLGQRATKTSTT